MTTRQLQPGDSAPNFTLYATPTETLSLDKQRGSAVALAFYPSPWSAADVHQVTLLNSALPEFAQRGANVMALSVDSKWCHWVFAEQHRLRFPLLADFNPKGAVGHTVSIEEMRKSLNERSSLSTEMESSVGAIGRTQSSVRGLTSSSMLL